MDDLPRREPWVGGRVPVGRQFIGPEQPHLAALRFEDAGLDHAGDARVLGLGELFGHAVLALGEARLLEPGQRPAAVGVEVALLFGQRLVERLVDERQRLAHGERLALRVEHLGVARVDRHARADGRLREVDRRDVAALKMGERRGQFGLERGDELAACGSGCVRRRACGRRGRCWRRARWSPVPACGSWLLSSHGPRAADGEARADHRIEEGLPAGARRALIALGLRLA